MHLKQLLELWNQQLQVWARSGQLLAAALDALHIEASPPELSELIAEISEGGINLLPPVELLDNGAMPGAAGAYAASTGTIYLNGDWLLTANDKQAVAVLTEEFGHHPVSYTHLRAHET